MRYCFPTILLLCLGAIVAYAEEQEPTSPTGLSSAEAAQGFVSIFNGKSLDGWVGLDDDTSSYYVKEGALVCKPTGKKHLFTEREYADFVLRIQIKLDPGGNNGVGIRTRINQAPHIYGMEVQVLEDAYYADGDPIKLKNYQHHGSIYGVVPAKTGHLKPAGQWNDEEIVCDGRHVKVSLNGVVIVDADLDQVEPLDQQEHPGLDYEKGRISLHAHGNYGAEVFFRNVRVKELKKTGATKNTTSAGGKRAFRAGACAIDITPKKLPVLVNGGFRSRIADRVIDPLHTRCLVLDDGTTQVAFAIVDSCLIPRAIFDQAKQQASAATGIPVERMLMSATHTHSAPSVTGVLGTDVQEDYAAWLPGRIAQGVVAAWKNLAPARIGWSSADDSRNVFCRRYLMKPGTAHTCPFTGSTDDRAQMNPGHANSNKVSRTGPRDTEVSVVSIQSRAGRPISLLANYSTHYAGSPALSADYFGVFCRKMKEKTGAADIEPPFVAMLTNGTSGDANCIDFEDSTRKFDYVSVAEDVSNAALAAYRKIEYHDWVPIVMAEERLTLSVRKPTEREAAEARAYLEKHVQDGPPKTQAEVYARETVFLAELPPTRELKLQVIRLGSLGIAAIPNELYAETGLAIKRDTPLKRTFTISLANGCEGYLPPPDQFTYGGYTTWRARTSCLEVQAEPRIRGTIMKLLGQVAAQRADFTK